MAPKVKWVILGAVPGWRGWGCGREGCLLRTECCEMLVQLRRRRRRRMGLGVWHSQAGGLTVLHSRTWAACLAPSRPRAACSPPQPWQGFCEGTETGKREGLGRREQSRHKTTPRCSISADSHRCAELIGAPGPAAGDCHPQTPLRLVGGASRSFFLVYTQASRFFRLAPSPVRSPPLCGWIHHHCCKPWRDVEEQAERAPGCGEPASPGSAPRTGAPSWSRPARAALPAPPLASRQIGRAHV